MTTVEIIVYVISAIVLVVGLLLSNSGSTGGLAAVSGQDLEIFKRAKDRGIIKILQIIMFTLVFLLITAAIIYRVTITIIPQA